VHSSQASVIQMPRSRKSFSLCSLLNFIEARTSATPGPCKRRSCGVPFRSRCVRVSTSGTQLPCCLAQKLNEFLGATWAQNPAGMRQKRNGQASKGSRFSGILVGAVGIETTRSLETREFCGAPWPSK
jgi:hypothetical protein